MTQHLADGIAQSDGCVLNNGMLCKEDNNRVCIVVPSNALDLKQQILKELHESIFEGHLGARKLSRSVSDRFAWTGLESEVREYCHLCSTY